MTRTEALKELRRRISTTESDAITISPDMDTETAAEVANILTS